METKRKKPVSKPKVKTIDNVLAESFVYDPNQKLYRTKAPITKQEDGNALVSQFAKFCSEKNGKLVYTGYYINKHYANSYSNNLSSSKFLGFFSFFVPSKNKRLNRSILF